MRHRFDWLSKHIGQKALDLSGLTVVQDEISSDAHHADLRHEPDPAREAERERLGLLGRLASTLCLMEIFSGAPDEDEALACVGKLILFRQQLRRHARNATRERRRRSMRNKKRGGKRKRPQDQVFVRPFVWIITAGRPTGVLRALAALRAQGWPRGVYFGPGILLGAGGVRLAGLDGAGGLLRVGVVVASELPRERSTILVRLMAAGPLLRDAIADLSALPPDAYERDIASQILLGLQQALGSKPNRTTEEEEFIVSMRDFVEELREEGRAEGREEGRAEGREEGRAEGRSHARSVLRRVLSVRKLTPSSRHQAQIDRCNDLSTLDRWIEQALIAQSVTEALRLNGARATVRAAARRGRSKTSS